MKLQETTALIFTGLLIALLVLVSVFSSIVILSNYSDLEQQYTAKDLQQAVTRVEDETNTLSAIVSDWGPWDDDYNFVQGNKPDFVITNLVPDTFNNLRVNVILIIDKNGRVVYSGAYNFSDNMMVPVPEDLISQLGPENPLMNTSDPRRDTRGIILLTEQPMIIASRPIVRTDFSGEPQGVVIMGRYLDDGEVSRLALLTLPTLRFFRVTDPALSPAILQNLEEKASGGRFIQATDRNDIDGYAMLRDIYGNDALVLTIRDFRSIYQQGLTTTLRFILIILFAGLLFGVFVMVLLDRLVLSRLGKLVAQVHSIGNTTPGSDRVDIGGRDEFSGLASEINRMLDTIDTISRKVHASETRFRELAELLPQIIFEMDTDGNILYINKAGAEQFGVSEQRISQGINVRLFLHPDHLEQMARGLAAVAAGSPSPGEIYSLRRPDGTILKAIVSTSLIRKEGRITGFRGIVVDVTDRVDLEQALTESREYLQSLFSSVQVGILVIDAQTHRIIDVNAAALWLIGAVREQVIGQVCHRFVCPAKEGFCPITDLGQHVDNAERVLLTLNGEKISIIKYVVPVMLNGRTCLLETFIDNTIRKKIESDLRESTGLLNGILQASPVGVYRLDPSGRVTFANDTFSKITGVPFENIQGKYWADILPEEERKRLLDKIRTPVRDRRTSSAEVRYIHPDGTPYWLYGQTVPLADATGNLNGWVGTITNITGQKLAEDALKESEEKYRALTENTPDILFSTDMLGIITYASPQINKYGFLEEEVIGKTLRILIHPADAALVESNLSHELEKGAQFVSRFRVLDKWGTIYWFEEKSSLRLDEAGHPIGIYGILRDVTERKRVEDAIDIANKKLNLLNQITRHDILNTITGLLGCVDMAKATDVPEERILLLNDIRDLTRVIQRHITFTREYQEVGIHLPQWQNVNDLVNKVVQNFTKSGIIFHSDFERTEIYADPLLEKVFYNLIDNALRYGETLTTIAIYPTVSDSGFSIVFEDDGAGVPDSQKREIFKRGVGKNTGMGLFLSAEILAITGITIVENGICGKGARFEIRIPNGTWRLPRS
jgi:PAS domain S-box-containing protein